MSRNVVHANRSPRKPRLSNGKRAPVVVKKLDKPRGQAAPEAGATLMSEEQSKASVVVDTLDVEIPWYVHTCNQGTEVCRALTAAFPYAAKGHLVLVHVKEERVADRNEPQRHRYHHSEWRLYMFVDHDLRFVTDERAEWSSWQRVESHPYNHDNRYRAVPPPVLDRDELPDDDDGYFTRGDVALVRDGDDALVMYALDRGKWKPVNST